LTFKSFLCSDHFAMSTNANRRTRRYRLLSGGLALLLIFASMTWCLCSPQQKSAACQGCCAPTRASLNAGTNCCRIVNPTVPVSSRAQDAAVLDVTVAQAAVHGFPASRLIPRAAPPATPFVSSPPLVLRV
jgi:hypothetical protein